MSKTMETLQAAFDKAVKNAPDQTRPLFEAAHQQARALQDHFENPDALKPGLLRFAFDAFRKEQRFNSAFTKLRRAAQKDPQSKSAFTDYALALYDFRKR